jgi:hypothetical protein
MRHARTCMQHGTVQYVGFDSHTSCTYASEHHGYMAFAAGTHSPQSSTILSRRNHARCCTTVYCWGNQHQDEHGGTYKSPPSPYSRARHSLASVSITMYSRTTCLDSNSERASTSDITSSKSCTPRRRHVSVWTPCGAFACPTTRRAKANPTDMDGSPLERGLHTLVVRTPGTNSCP